MPKKKRTGSCIAKSGKRVPRKKTGRKGCPKGSRPARKSKRRTKKK